MKSGLQSIIYTTELRSQDVLAEKILSAGTQLVYFIWRQTCSCNVIIMGEVCCVAMYMYNYTIKISGIREEVQ